MLQQLFEMDDVAQLFEEDEVKWMVLQQLFKVDDVAQLFSVCCCSNCLKWALRKCV